MKALCYLWCKQNSKEMKQFTLIVKPKFAQKIRKAHAHKHVYQMVRNEVKIAIHK